ncbi:MAG: CoA pyrophosphatase [Flavobacteriales bacterium]|nr:CoA pyrophosphatase [Flavobacteriales bacterium]
MDFEEFQTRLATQLQQPLPGIDAQLKLAPYARLTRKMAKELDTKPRLSAVLALFFPKNNEPHILLTLRNSYNGVHSQQVSFPGGKQEDSDHSFEQTALRETEEEVGIRPNSIQIIGKLTEVYIPPSRFLVHPFVGVTTAMPEYKTDTVEVAEIIECSLSQLLDDDLVKEKDIFVSTTQLKMRTPYFDISGHVVWGATAIMLSELKEIIKKIV